MREKLIQIIVKHTGDDYEAPVAVEEFFASLRCDKCRHWKAFRTALGTCQAQTAWYLEIVDAGEFCSHWEPKQ